MIRGKTNSKTLKTYLIVLVEPEESKVGNSDRLPVILNLFTSAVNNMGHFVSNDKF